MRTWYKTIVNSDRYALAELPPSQRFQVMASLSLMWTAIFCAGTGAWLWYGEIAVAHVLVALGLVATTVTFRSARRRTGAAMVERARGAVGVAETNT